MEEMRQSVAIIGQAIEKINFEDGPVLAQGKLCPPRRVEMKQSMEALIHHFKLYTEGFHVPEGSVRIRGGSKGEFGVYLVSDGTSKPYRVKSELRYLHLQAMDHMASGHQLADVPLLSEPWT